MKTISDLGYLAAYLYLFLQMANRFLAGHYLQGWLLLVILALLPERPPKAWASR